MQIKIKLSALRTLLKNESVNSSGMFCPCVAIQMDVDKGEAVFFKTVLASSHGLSNIKGLTVWHNDGEYKHNKSDVYDYIVDNIEDVIKKDLFNAEVHDYESDFAEGYEVLD